jgi:alkanesulfonate monooxygenase SsuD/methylene tetrahydromethanopterin reductase-like flavin-dependent oxidoreductase (luciferase family)
MFAACSKPESAASVGALGLGALNFALGNDEFLKQKVADYRAAAAKAKPKNFQPHNHFACTPPTLVLPDDTKACRYGFRAARFFAESMGNYYFGSNRPVGKLNVPRDFLLDDELKDAMAYRGAAGSQCTAIIGDPSAACEMVQRFVDTGVDELICVMQMGTLPHELVMESIRTFGEQVIPRFRSEVKVAEGSAA